MPPDDDDTEERDDSGEDDDDEDDDDDASFADVGSAAASARLPKGDATADRVSFGEDLWGVSARQRAAVMDPERLAHFGLPALANERDLAAWFGVSLGRLRWYTHDRAADTTWHYMRYALPKRGGGERVILAPKPELKALQRKVLAGIATLVPVAATTHGFVRGRSIVSNARQHAGKPVVLKLDLKDFFPSVTFPRVRGLFVALGYPYAVASALALLCTEYAREPFDRDGTRYYISIGPRHLVQGAPTSPALANLVAWRLDRRLGGLAARRGYTYTRYADDLTFSGDDVAGVQRFRAAVQRIIADERFTVNVKKTRIARRSARQTVTGLVVNDGLATPRQTRRRLRAILHNAGKTGLAGQNRDQRRDFRAYLQGLIGHVHAASARHAAPLAASLRRVVSGA
jgi:retron-type reverse transcriptase